MQTSRRGRAHDATSAQLERPKTHSAGAVGASGSFITLDTWRDVVGPVDRIARMGFDRA